MSSSKTLVLFAFAVSFLILETECSKVLQGGSRYASGGMAAPGKGDDSSDDESLSDRDRTVSIYSSSSSDSEDEVKVVYMGKNKLKWLGGNTWYEPATKKIIYTVRGRFPKDVEPRITVKTEPKSDSDHEPKQKKKKTAKKDGKKTGDKRGKKDCKKRGPKKDC